MLTNLLGILERVLNHGNILQISLPWQDSINALEANVSLARKIILVNRDSQSLNSELFWRLLECGTVVQVKLIDCVVVLNDVLSVEAALQFVQDSREYERSFVLNQALAIAITEDRGCAEQLLGTQLWKELLAMTRIKDLQISEEPSEKLSNLLFRDVLCILELILGTDKILHLTLPWEESHNAFEDNMTLSRKIVEVNRESQVINLNLFWKLMDCGKKDQETCVECMKTINESLAIEEVFQFVQGSDEYQRALASNYALAISISEDNECAQQLTRTELWKRLLVITRMKIPEYISLNLPEAVKANMKSSDGNFESATRTLENLRNIIKVMSQDMKNLTDMFQYCLKEEKDSKEATRLLPLSLQFDIKPFTMTCCKVLEDSLSIQNCVNIFKLASQVEMDNLWEKAFAFILKIFSKLLQENGEMLSLSFAEMCLILFSDLLISDEAKVYEAVRKWVAADKLNRAQHIPTLMRAVRFPCCDIALLQRMDESHFLYDFPEVRDLIKPLIDFATSNTTEYKVQAIQSSRQHLKPLPKDVLFLIGGCGYTSGVSTFDSSKARWNEDVIKQSGSETFTRAVAVGRIIFVVDNKGENIQIFNPETLKWKRKSSLPSPRHCMAIAMLDRRVYLIGGRFHKKEFTNRTDIYDLETDTWIKASHMNYKRGFAAATALNGKIYCSGGQESLKTLESYNPESNVWEINQAMLIPRAGHCMVSCSRYIWVIGGVTSKVLNDMERYDPETNSWTSMLPMPTPRRDMMASILNGSLYVIGGIEEDCVEAYNFKLGLWEKKPQLGGKRYLSGCCVVDGLPTAEAYFTSD